MPVNQQQRAQFEAIYQSLNAEQKKAVDTIEGPVLVIAGPGTGKTQIIGARIARILLSDVQAAPGNILCLTYTDAGTIAMRERLLKFIGPEAHRVAIHTFHSFCSEVIRQNNQYFGQRELEPASDLEKINIMTEILDELPEGHALRRLSGNIYHDGKNLLQFFSVMKQEGWTEASIGEKIDEYIRELPTREGYFYKTKYKDKKPGDLKQAEFDKESDRMERTRAAASLLDTYNEKLAKYERFDFDDMILWVRRAFHEHEALLRSYQERFLYVLVDEYQDTNGVQNEILRMLISFWPDPNVFVVGDDDQAIYEFQGARIRNIMDFYREYEATLRVIVLTDNYRSTQPVLDTARTVIDHNKDRLIEYLKHLQISKNLKAEGKAVKDLRIKTRLIAWHNTLHEEISLVNELEELWKNGEALQNTAVIYRKNSQAANIVRLLENKGIPYTMKKKINLLDEPLVKQLIKILQYLQAESTSPHSGEHHLFELLHFRHWHVHPHDVARLSLYLRKNRGIFSTWRDLLNDGKKLKELELQSLHEIVKVNDCINKWLKDLHNLTLPMVFENVLYESHIVQNILNEADRIWQMQILNTLFDFIRDECARNPRTTIGEFTDLVEQMKRESIVLPLWKIVYQQNGVYLTTAHSSKGLEFERVYLMGCDAENWTKGAANRGFKLPETLTLSRDTENLESVRRLFYVAMTRAKKHLTISWPGHDKKGEKQLPVVFVEEIKDSGIEAEWLEKHLDDETLVEQLVQSMQPEPEMDLDLLKKQYLDERLEGYVLSPSTLNKYLKCPVAFYYENLLKVPSAPNDSLAFGISIHSALQWWFETMRKNGSEFPAPKVLVQEFERIMKKNEESFTEKQFSRRLELGRRTLTDYYDHYADSLNKIAICEYMVRGVEIDGIPVEGKMDKLEFNGNDVTVVDYKTGNPGNSIAKHLRPPDEKNPNGGDYWRQIVFYKLLMDGQRSKPWRMVRGLFDYVQMDEKKKQFLQQEVIPSAADLTTVRQQIKTVYEKIMNHEFSQGCNEDDCVWCTFVKTNQLSKPIPVENAEPEMM